MKQLDISEFDRDHCPVFKAVSEIGDAWTLLILRECFLGFRRFEEFQQNLGISKSVLATKIRKLLAGGILRKKEYQVPGQRTRFEYRLTAKGRDLQHVIISLLEWGNRHHSAEKVDQLSVRELRTGGSTRLAILNSSDQPVGPRDISLQLWRD